MASNVEGEALKRMSGASAKPGGVSGVVKGLLADKWLRSQSSGGGSGKTAADWHNEEVSKQYDFGRSQTSKDSDIDRTVKLATANKDNNLGVRGHQSADHKVELYARTAAPKRTRTTPTSTNGQGTSGNVQGPQFKKRTTGKPSVA